MSTYKLGEKLLTLNNRQFVLLDIVIFLITPLLSLILRLDDLALINQYRYGLVIATICFLVMKLSVFASFNFYKHYWRYASVEELLEIVLMTVMAAVAETVLLIVVNTFSPVYLVPLSLPLLDALLSMILVGGIRFSVRVVDFSRQKNRQYYRRDRTLIVGAGDSGVAIVKEMERNPKLGFLPLAFIDDDVSKLGLTIAGLPVAGDRFSLPEVVASYGIRQVVIAMPTASGAIVRNIVDMCRAISVRTVTLPAIDEVLDYKASLNQVREVKIEDLLRRVPIQTDTKGVLNFVRGKTVLVTGGGGSIGSELCRQIFRCHPKKIILVGHGENSIFNIQQELLQVVRILKQSAAEEVQIPEIVAFIGDLRFVSRLESAYETHRPDIVFHAAAHKHVPLMEENPPEAISNNLIGTKNLLDLAMRYDVANFVMISTDKAVNPTNIMGASKRAAEMLVLQAAIKTDRPYVVVRFGNVLGSRGSVVPTFRRQIAQGGPVTITHPEITRYFMTIPEAVQLVLQASVLSRSDQIFMLNMGEPVKILDLAKDLIELSGYEVGKDIDIIFTGLRPGEKLHEELLIDGEKYASTPHEKLLVVKNASSIIPENFDSLVSILTKAALNNDVNLILFVMDRLVPGYEPKDRCIDHESAQECLEAIIHDSCLGENSSNRDGDNSSRDALVESLTMFESQQPLLQHLERQLRQGLENEEFFILYQPVMDFSTGKFDELEALLRWQHPDLGVLAPSQFMDIAEETGLIIPLQRWIVEQVCRQSSIWQEEGFPRNWKIGINLHSRHLLSADLARHIQYNLDRYQIQPQNLRVDIAEYLIRENPYAAMTLTTQLKTIGVALQLDNFGIITSYNSLPTANLLYQHFDRIKLDRFLINRIDKDHESLSLFHNLRAKARDLGIKVGAVGIENSAQLKEIRANEIEYGQGYFLHRPLATGSITRLTRGYFKEN